MRGFLSNIPHYSLNIWLLKSWNKYLISWLPFHVDFKSNLITLESLSIFLASRLGGGGGGRGPPTQYYLGYAYARSLPLKAPPPLSPDWQHFWTPFRGLFAGFSCLGDPPKSKTLLNVPPIFYFITPFLNFSGVQRERERKTTPFLKKSPGEKSNPPLFSFFSFLQFSGRTLSHEKHPFTGDFGNTHAVPPTTEWGGGGRARAPPPPYSYATDNVISLLMWIWLGGILVGSLGFHE